MLVEEAMEEAVVVMEEVENAVAVTVLEESAVAAAVAMEVEERVEDGEGDAVAAVLLDCKVLPETVMDEDTEVREDGVMDWGTVAVPLEHRVCEVVVELDTLGLAEERAVMEGMAEAAGVLVLEPVEMTDRERVGETLLLVVASVPLNHVPRMTIP